VRNNGRKQQICCSCDTDSINRNAGLNICLIRKWAFKEFHSGLGANYQIPTIHVELRDCSKDKICKGRHAKVAMDIILLYDTVFILHALT